jgi:TonB family protein
MTFALRLVVVAVVVQSALVAAQTGQSPAELRRAAEKGDMAAAFRLGLAYREGIGVAQDLVEADIWLGMAGMLETGPDRARYTLEAEELERRLTPEQGREASKRGAAMMIRIADGGHARAQVTVALFYVAGSAELGVPQDTAKGLDYLQRSARQNDPEAQYILGRVHEGQYGLPQDYSQSLLWFRRAAAQGHPGAMVALGVMHAQGVAVAPDPIEAYKWLTLAASRGTNAQEAEAIKFRDGLETQLTDAQAADAISRAQEWLDAFVDVYGSNPPVPLPPRTDVPPPPPPPPSEPVRVGGDIPAPTKIKDVPPQYPAVAQSARIQGVVIIEATIAGDGTVADAVVLRSPSPLLEIPALEAVRQWRFTPTLLNGVPVEVIMTVTVNFSLN